MVKGGSSITERSRCRTRKKMRENKRKHKKPEKSMSGKNRGMHQ